MASDVRCGTCKYAVWPRDKRGRRMKKDRVGKCLCPVPPIPKRFLNFQTTDGHGNLRSDPVFAELGQGCETWTLEEKP